jgi:hypothetical protein
VLLVDVSVIIGLQLVVENDARDGGAFGFKALALDLEHAVQLRVVGELARFHEAGVIPLFGGAVDRGAGVVEELASFRRQDGDPLGATVHEHVVCLRQSLLAKRSDVTVEGRSVRVRCARSGRLEIAKGYNAECADGREQLGFGVAESEAFAIQSDGTTFGRARERETASGGPAVGGAIGFAVDGVPGFRIRPGRFIRPGEVVVSGIAGHVIRPEWRVSRRRGRIVACLGVGVGAGGDSVWADADTVTDSALR